MNIHIQNIPMIIFDDQHLVNLKWLRGASRYNNGGTVHKHKYAFRLLISRAKESNRQISLSREKNAR